ncbi:MAG: hypothetical protein PHY48_03205 [Candidatus Cloacimonetes bacterium]|nr:hypothetical protein [Candidatus Cloacimonadota bacterium]
MSGVLCAYANYMSTYNLTAHWTSGNTFIIGSEGKASVKFSDIPLFSEVQNAAKIQVAIKI